MDFYATRKQEGVPYRYDLFDRIINVKIKRGDSKGYNPAYDIIIRSDYETFANNGKIDVRRTVIKPDISVSYTQVTNSISINFEVRIANFHQYTMDGESLESFYNAEIKPLSVEVHMGYASQFPDLMTKEYLDSPEKLKDAYCNFKNEKSTKVIEGTILHCYQDKSSVDSYFILSCSYAAGEKEGSVKSVIRKGSLLNEYLYETITKNIAYSSAGFITPSSSDEGLKVFVADEVEQLFAKTVDDMVDPETGESIPIEIQLNTSSFASSFVQKLRELLLAENINYTYASFEGKPCLLIYRTVAGIDNAYAYKNIKYSNDETSIQAVYSVQLSATPVITAPFLSEINALTNVKVKCRYASTDLVAYFYRPQIKEEYLTLKVINIKVDFSTVQNSNTMQLTCAYVKE